jgi:hypothetical protein
MRTAKEFLEQECQNLGVVLEETLRFKYGPDGSKQFFEECQDRLAYVTGEIAKATATNTAGLEKAAFLLVQLSELVSRIERSSMGEYSWPFVEELKRLATVLCAEETLTDKNRAPKVHVLSDGGLDKYAIFTESNRASSAGKRILTIVFPRSLKHFVLLHSILGHEIGHAMWQCSKHQKDLKDVFGQHLFATGIFSSPQQTAQWLYSNSAPNELKAQLAHLATFGITQANFFGGWASWKAWTEEILCDFVGLLTFGPSFVAAECNLLYSLSAAGSTAGPRHPPVGCRINYLLQGTHIRGHDAENFADARLKDDVHAYWATLTARKQPSQWFDVFTDAQIKSTTDALSGLLATLPPAPYVAPSETDLIHLVDCLRSAVPPTGFEVAKHGTFSCRSVDFRHILYAGWIASTAVNDLKFKEINRLCEHGIMQQRAIDIELGPDPNGSVS